MGFTEIEQNIISQAIDILHKSLLREGVALTTPTAVKQYLQLRIGAEERENFSIMLLDNQHRLIKFETLFVGTIDAANIYPREVVKSVLNCNAAVCIFAHNHPSGIVEASSADKAITVRLVDALRLIDVSVLDHIIVSPTDVLSFAERGLI